MKFKMTKSEPNRTMNSYIKRTIPLLAVFLSFSSCKKEKTTDDPIYSMTYKEAIMDCRRELNGFMLTSSIPGISVCVSIEGELVYSEGIGLANKELNAPARRNTKFRIGSTSQIFTNYLIAKLQEEGALDVDNSFYDYIPDFPKKRYDFTLRMLANQVAGFPESPNHTPVENRDLKSLKAYISKHENDSMVYEPGTYFLKSDFSIALLGILAEDITQKNYSKLIREMILDTLHLENTLLDNSLQIIPNRSACYHRDYIARLVNAPDVNLLPAAPALGFLSTADDLNQAARQIMEPGFFTQETIDLFREPYQLSTGQQLRSSFGWIVTSDQSGRKLTAQVGATMGGSSAIAVFPDQKLVVSMCSNLGDEMQELPILQVANHFLKYLDPVADEKNESKTEESE